MGGGGGGGGVCFYRLRDSTVKRWHIQDILIKSDFRVSSRVIDCNADGTWELQ